MILFWKRATRYTTLALSIWFLLTALAACGDTTTSDPQPKSAPVVTLRTYQGAGFTLNYPSNWGVHASGNQVTFADPQGRNVLAIFADPDRAGEPDASVVADQAMSHFKGTLLANAQDISAPQTFTTGKVTWIQRSATGSLAITDPGVQGNLFLLVTNFPPQAKNTVTYEVEYYGPTATFGQANVSFMQMLQSFTFTTR
ncbi:hypothetical protein KSC_040780 [Ktedonobacter sp. SOSP1-52]|uniref:hypothetical protein n=1 Tax=Ktedonobacter sp. SOSP1-52 TaxID=2778366 RepID=UPI0019159836|nr:hypothetical protein [Ktedonobacter sp. SOSP1-52]GHO65186.1 hypothetical protein KSC_040780 [Ktedonobacter sp. SOSP1-52]